MELYRKNTLLEVIEVLENGDRKVRNQGDPSDVWIIPWETFMSTYDKVWEEE